MHCQHLVLFLLYFLVSLRGSYTIIIISRLTILKVNKTDTDIVRDSYNTGGTIYLVRQWRESSDADQDQ